MRCAALLIALVLIALGSAQAADSIPVPQPAAAAPAPAPAASRGWLGVSLDEVDAPLAYHLGLEHDLGVLVTAVEPGSPAAQMGIAAWDVIVQFNQVAIYTPRALAEAVRAVKPGERIELVVRRGARSETLGGPLAQAPARSDDPAADLRERFERQLRQRPAGPRFQWEPADRPSEF